MNAIQLLIAEYENVNGAARRARHDDGAILYDRVGGMKVDEPGLPDLGNPEHERHDEGLGNIPPGAPGS